MKSLNAISPWRIPPELSLSDFERQRIILETHQRIDRRSVRVRWRDELPYMVSMMTLIVVFFCILTQFDSTQTEWVTYLVIPGLVVAVVTGLYVQRRTTYRRYLHQALRARGFDLCDSCRYWLRDLPDETERCPECGKALSSNRRDT